LRAIALVAVPACLAAWTAAQALADEAASAPASGEPGRAAAAVILQTRTWSPDGKVPTGTIWRTFQTWQTDIARTEKGELVRVDPMTPRVAIPDKGLPVRLASSSAPPRRGR
jgi:hypothetical protein